MRSAILLKASSSKRPFDAEPLVFMSRFKGQRQKSRSTSSLLSYRVAGWSFLTTNYQRRAPCSLRIVKRGILDRLPGDLLGGTFILRTGSGLPSFHKKTPFFTPVPPTHQHTS